MRKWVLFVVAALALVALPGCGSDCDVVPLAPVVEHEDDDCRDRGDDGRDSLVVNHPWPRPPKK